MGRLTIKTEHGKTTLKDCTISLRNAIEKLAHYEDLEEQGLLMRLPCKSGDMIYKVCEGKVYKNVVSRIEVFGSKNYLVLFDYGEDELCVMSADYNVVWFTSEAEAEKALAEMEK